MTQASPHKPEETIRHGEHGLVRVFVLSRPADLERGAELSLIQIANWIGVANLNAVDVQQVWTDDMVDVPIEGLLSEGYGIDRAEIAQHASDLNAAMEMHPTIFVLIRSGAFVDPPVTLQPNGPLFLIATLREPGANVVFEPLPNPDPQAVLTDAPQKKKPSDAAMSGRIATLALLVMGLLVWLMIWIAG